MSPQTPTPPLRIQVPSKDNLGTHPLTLDTLATMHFQIFIKSLEGKSISMTVYNMEEVEYLTKKFNTLLGIPTRLQRNIYARKTLQEESKLQYYGIECDSLIILNTILGGCFGST